MEEKHSARSSRRSSIPLDPVRELIWFSLVSTCIKLLLVPSYRSTDFEVHRNWLAITHSLPLTKWYFDTSSPWTLDYPPFFAYFELILSFFASQIDPIIVDLHKGLNYEANSVIYFQRVTVMLSDFVLHFAIYRITRKFDSTKRRLIWVLVFFAPALLIVDHMHFQYNGFMLGILLLSISALMEGRDLIGGFLFAVLLCFKHLFAVAAPVYFVYLLRHYCRGGFVKGFMRLLMMGSVVLAVFSVAFGPFVYHGQILQVIHQMFPFGRGLCHAYWAPNFWVFYIIFDKLISLMLRKAGFNVPRPSGSFTGGLVGDSSPFAVLPQVTPLITALSVILAMLPCLFRAWRQPQPTKITRWISYAYTCGFLFGWHVHEKAVLHFLIPLAVVALDSPNDAKHHFILATASCYSLFPLLFEVREYPIKLLLAILHATLIWFGFSSYLSVLTSPKAIAEEGCDQLKPEEISSTSCGTERFSFGWPGKSYLLGFSVVEVWVQILHPIFFGDKFPFLPLMLISIYCALGIFYSWIYQLRQIMNCS